MGWLNKLSGLEQRLDKCFKGLDNIYDKVIEEHRDPERPEPEHEDLVHVLLRVQNDPNQAIALTNDQMKGVIAVCILFISVSFSIVLISMCLLVSC